MAKKPKATKRSPPRRAISQSKDPVTHYAQKVAWGKIVAGPHVRASCERHLRDLKQADQRGLVWDLDQAQHAIGFFEEMLCLNGGDFEGVPFKLLLWQKFIVGSIFGWKQKADGTRRFRVAYIETGKGSGKSPLAAGVGLYGLVADGEHRAEVYAAATKKDQAMILFRDAIAMRDLSPELANVLHSSGAKGKEWNLAYHDTMSFFRPISADDGQSGPRPHIGLLDEVHEHKNGTVVEMMRAGTKGRKQALIFMITNSGADRRSICWDYHEYGGQVAAGMIEDDSFFSYICALDPDDDPFVDERCWIKANPSLGVTIQPRYLREQVTQARGMPSKEALVKRLNFCMWVEGSNPWLSRDSWMSAGEHYLLEDLEGRDCIGGLDLGSTQDLCSLVLLFEPTEDDPQYRIVPYFWLPEDGLTEKAEKDRVPYHKWVADGWLETTPGRATSRLWVLRRLTAIMDRVNLKSLAYDRWRMEDLQRLAEDEGLTMPQMIPFGQGFRDMSPAVEEFERILLNGNLRHNSNPVMTWCAANAVLVEDPAGNRKVAKDKATGRVDGIVASLMAVGKIGEVQDTRSVYETRGIVEINL